jgi:RNA polymerase primary sigma factor
MLDDDGDAGDEYRHSHLPDERTREFAGRMHYAAYRIKQSADPEEAHYWKGRYLAWRDRIILGNLKLAYRAVRRWRPGQRQIEDLVGDCQVVLIQAVAGFNPWVGIRFSTYAFTCLMRALSRLTQRQSADHLARAVSLDALAAGEPRELADATPAPGSVLRLDEYLHESHPLLSGREKLVLARRFWPTGPEGEMTLEELGKQLGISKERVRQLQASGLDKLRRALLGTAHAG